MNDENFCLDGDGKFDSMYLDDINDDPLFNPGVTYPGVELMAEDYGDMIMEEQPNEDDLTEQAIDDKYLNAELILSIGMNNERQGHVIK